jgi:hypothetical protein
MLTCERVVVRNKGNYDIYGKLIKWHEKCGLRAEEHELTGQLAIVKAVLCGRHYLEALEEIRKQSLGIGKPNYHTKAKEQMDFSDIGRSDASEASRQ